MSVNPLNNPVTEAVASIAAKELVSIIKQCDAEHWGKQRRWAAVSYIKFLTFGIVDWPILKIEPTVQVAWLTKDEQNLIDRLVLEAERTVQLDEELRDLVITAS